MNPTLHATCVNISASELQMVMNIAVQVLVEMVARSAFDCGFMCHVSCRAVESLLVL